MQQYACPHQFNLWEKNVQAMNDCVMILNQIYTVPLKFWWCHTFAFRPYFVVILKNGTIVMVRTVPHKMPPIKPTMCCCHGNVPMANMHTAKKINFISAICGRFNCFQWIIIRRTAIDDTTPAIDANGPT